MRRRPLRAAVAAAAAVALLAGGCGDDSSTLPTPEPRDIAVDTPELRQMKQEAGMEPCRPGPGGGALPATTLRCLGGGQDVDLATLRGPMIINLWASTCGPCRKEMPVLQEFHATYGDRVKVLGIDYLDVHPVSAMEQVIERGVTYPSLADPLGDLQEQPVFEQYWGLPVILFLDADGEVAGDKVGGVHTLDELVELTETHLDVELGDAA